MSFWDMLQTGTSAPSYGMGVGDNANTAAPPLFYDQSSGLSPDDLMRVLSPQHQPNASMDYASPPGDHMRNLLAGSDSGNANMMPNSPMPQQPPQMPGDTQSPAMPSPLLNTPQQQPAAPQGDMTSMLSQLQGYLKTVLQQPVEEQEKPVIAGMTRSDLVRLGLGTMAAGSKPGATLLGSLGQGGQEIFTGRDAEAKKQAEIRKENQEALKNAGQNFYESAKAKNYADYHEGKNAIDQERAHTYQQKTDALAGHYKAIEEHYKADTGITKAALIRAKDYEAKGYDSATAKDMAYQEVLHKSVSPDQAANQAYLAAKKNFSSESDAMAEANQVRQSWADRQMQQQGGTQQPRLTSTQPNGGVATPLAATSDTPETLSVVDSKVLNGQTYVKRANGKWYPR